MHAKKYSSFAVRWNRAAVFASLLVCGGWVAPTIAQYPVKPLRLISPFPPGGGTEIVARQSAQGLATERK